MHTPDIFTKALDSKLMAPVGIILSSALAVVHNEAQGATLPAQALTAVLFNPITWLWVLYLLVKLCREVIDWYRHERRYRRKRKGLGPDDDTDMPPLRQMDGRP
ncbi:MAG: hypothetical protein V4757_07065 [Pseudomonadota bacterium]